MQARPARREQPQEIGRYRLFRALLARPRPGGDTLSAPMRRERLTELIRVLRYVYRLGFVDGVTALVRFRSHRLLVKVHAPGQAEPIYARPRTSDVPTFEKIFVFREYDFPYPISSSGLIVDAGANVGHASAFFASKYPHSTVVALEPDRSNFEILLRNTERYRNVRTLHAAVWGRDARLRIENPEDDPWAFRVTETSPGDPSSIRGLTIHSIMREMQVTHVDLLKIDIEGAEKELFEADPGGWLKNVRAIVIELHDRERDGCSRAFYRATSMFPFNQYIARENVILVRYDSNAPDRLEP